MKQNAITMTTDNSRNRKQANHPGPVCLLVCVCTEEGRWTGVGGKKKRREKIKKKKKKQARVSDRELGGDRGRRVGGVSARKG